MPATTDSPLGYTRRSVQRRRGAVQQEVEDCIAEEVPIAFIYNGRPFAVMMATPADLDDFAIGFSLSEAIVASAEEIGEVRAETLLEGVQLNVRIPAAMQRALARRRRSLSGRSGCGLCGAELLEAAVRQPAPVGEGIQVGVMALRAALASLRMGQSLNALTGATHAAAWAAPNGAILLLREDVGRHNALDKLIGAMQRAGHDPQAGFLLVSSRASYEMALKAASVGIGLMAAISAPTALAIHLAERANLTLIGFAREDGHAVYSHPRRLLDD